MKLFGYLNCAMDRNRLLRNIVMIEKTDTSYLTQSALFTEHYQQSDWLSKDISGLLYSELSTVLTAVYFTPELQAGERLILLKKVKKCLTIEAVYLEDPRISGWVEALRVARHELTVSPPKTIRLGAVCVIADEENRSVDGFKLGAMLELSLTENIHGVLIASNNEEDAHIVVAKRFSYKDVMLADRKTLHFHMKINYENKSTSVLALLINSQF